MNKMGWAKYYEDNMSIYVGRMVMKESVPSYNVKVKPTHAVQIQIAQKKKPVAEIKKKKEIDYVKREKQNGCQGLELSFKVGIEDKMIKKLQVNGWWWSESNACWCNLDICQYVTVYGSRSCKKGSRACLKNKNCTKRMFYFLFFMIK